MLLQPKKMNNNQLGLYLVETGFEENGKLQVNEYRILADSVIEAAEIVQKYLEKEAKTVNNVEIELKYPVIKGFIISSRFVTHITELPTNKFKISLVANG